MGKVSQWLDKPVSRTTKLVSGIVAFSLVAGLPLYDRLKEPLFGQLPSPRELTRISEAPQLSRFRFIASFTLVGPSIPKGTVISTSSRVSRFLGKEEKIQTTTETIDGKTAEVTTSDAWDYAFVDMYRIEKITPAGIVMEDGLQIPFGEEKIVMKVPKTLNMADKDTYIGVRLPKKGSRCQFLECDPGEFEIYISNYKRY